MSHEETLRRAFDPVRHAHTAHGRQREPEGAAAARRGLDPDAPAVELDDLAADGEPEAGAGRLAVDLPAREELEDAIAVALAHAGAVVGHGQGPLARAARGADRDDRRRVAAELQRVGEQVLEHARELALDAEHGGQRPDLDARAGRLDLRRERVEQALDHPAQVDGLAPAAAPRPTRARSSSPSTSRRAVRGGARAGGR